MMNADKVLEKALPIYCDFINSFIPDEPECHYQPIDFTDDHERKHYGFAHLMYVVNGEPYCDPDLYIFRVSIGDEGGPATLYVWANDEMIVHMTHLFDTMLSNVAYTDGMTNKLVLETKFTE